MSDEHAQQKEALHTIKQKESKATNMVNELTAVRTFWWMIVWADWRGSISLSLLFILKYINFLKLLVIFSLKASLGDVTFHDFNLSGNIFLSILAFFLFSKNVFKTLYVLRRSVDGSRTRSVYFGKWTTKVRHASFALGINSLIPFVCSFFFSKFGFVSRGHHWSFYLLICT